MVKVKEIISNGAAPEDNDSGYEDIHDEEPILRESIADRFIALGDMFSIMKMSNLGHYARKLSQLVNKSAIFIGNIAWIFTTSMILIGLPILYAFDREKSTIEFEKEQMKFEKK